MENQTNIAMGGSGSPANKITSVELEVADALQDNGGLAHFNIDTSISWHACVISWQLLYIYNIFTTDNSGVLVGPEQNMIVKEADKLLLSPFNPSTMENKNSQFRFGWIFDMNDQAILQPVNGKLHLKTHT